MLTPADFIFNNELFSEYAEFNYPLQESQERIWQDRQYSYNAKISSNSVTTSSDFVVDKNDVDSYYNHKFATNFNIALNELRTYSFPKCDSLIFPGVRYLDQGIIVFERPPTYKIISTYNDYRDSINGSTDTSQYYLPVPWQTYIAMYNPSDMRLVSVKMFFTSNSLTSFDQTLYAPPLYNFYSNGTLCRPFFGSMEDIEKYSKDISGVIASAYDWIWNSGFNFDITENISFFLSSKKYFQFEKYLDPQNKPHFDWLKTHNFNNIPFQLPMKYHFNLYKCWEQIPLSEVSSISWNPYTTTDFYYQHINNLRENLLSDYIVNNDLFLHEDNFDSDYHDDDECPEECIFAHEITESSNYNSYVIDKINQENSTLLSAVESSVLFLRQNKLIQSPIPDVQVKKMFHSLLENTPFPS
jgi:hypothetical protein